MISRDTLRKRLISFRKKIKENRSKVIASIIKHGRRCSFCNSEKDIDREHVLPQWSYKKDNEASFINMSNNHNFYYAKSHIPSCKKCNSFILGELEQHIKSIIESYNANSDFSEEDLQLLLLWFEIIDYKFHVFDYYKLYIRDKKGEFIPCLKNIPLLDIPDHDSWTPCYAKRKLSKTLKKLVVKGRDEKFNSLVLLERTDDRTKIDLLHKMDDFIYIQTAVSKVCFFYFLDKRFDTLCDANNEAWSILKENNR